MKLHADNAEGVNLIHAYTRSSVSVNGEAHTRSILVPPTGPVIEWPVHALEDLSEAHFEAVVAARPEVLILGTGPTLRFAHPGLLRRLMAVRIGVETMDTAAACRTFNILVAEGRQVMAALLIAP
ncbi:Mth938-like domain-containing protein [Aquabacterium sp.]|uniref:Mth938-like domain-containing protein n=1 Tax=Aquabacterium sp. TaxID=1872578 RepID=UPI002488A52F|nr:Mth938-like domain-containing protein [Aquabacterium sp.]MDI1350617.1 Mth938-like domain-containing protein [Aquabacterium sp.]